MGRDSTNKEVDQVHFRNYRNYVMILHVRIKECGGDYIMTLLCVQQATL